MKGTCHLIASGVNFKPALTNQGLPIILKRKFAFFSSPLDLAAKAYSVFSKEIDLCSFINSNSGTEIPKTQTNCQIIKHN